MVILGVDAHKHTHTVVAVDDHGRQIASRTVGTTTTEHLALLRWVCGERVLINGAGGGVGTLGAQIAKLHDAELTGVDRGSKLRSSARSDSTMSSTTRRRTSRAVGGPTTSSWTSRPVDLRSATCAR
jgi:D-arabinose 1-dehydrogenase-like Zn-dependent alcohol dehydrogenase